MLTYNMAVLCLDSLVGWRESCLPSLRWRALCSATGVRGVRPHDLVEALASSRARVAEPQARSRGGNLSEEAVKALAVGFIRRRLGVAAVKAQSLSLLGRLEVMGPGGTVLAAGRRKAQEQE